MSGIITTGNFPKTKRPGLAAIFGNTYNEKPATWSQIFQTIASNKSYEEALEASSFGLAKVKPQGDEVTYDSDEQVDVIRTRHIVYGLGFIVTEEEIDDDLYAEVGARRAQNLAFSMRQTKENVAANVLNRAFNSSYTFGVDNPKELIATDHVTLDGTQSNELDPSADLSEASLEDLVIQIKKAKNNRGLKIGIRPEQLIVPDDLYFEAARILESQLQPGTANNDVNVLYTMGTIPKVLTNTYLTDEDAFFIQTDVPRGAIHYERKALAFSEDNDFSTNNLKYKAVERYSFTVEDWRAFYGSAGA